VASRLGLERDTGVGDATLESGGHSVVGNRDGHAVSLAGLVTSRAGREALGEGAIRNGGSGIRSLGDGGGSHGGGLSSRGGGGEEDSGDSVLHFVCLLSY